MNLAEALAVSGATYRQLDYWVRCGYLHEGVRYAQHTDRPLPEGAIAGSGSTRDWPAAEVEVARRMVRYTRAGLIVGVAAVAARRPSPVDLDHGLRLVDDTVRPPWELALEDDLRDAVDAGEQLVLQVPL
jgi:hypothetical protein